MKINCINCNIIFNRKPSEIGKNNFCSKICHNIYSKSHNLERKRINKFIKSSWTNINIRCGIYKRPKLNNKNKCYENITIEFNRKDFKYWCLIHGDIILKLNRPSINRIDSDKNYDFNNIEIIELIDNIRSKRPGTAYLNGPKSKDLRGIKKVSSGYSARITIKNKTTHLGTFKTKEEAYKVFKEAYVNYYGKEPW